MAALFELRLTSDKGLGLFALRKIARGTRIICEAPVVTITSPKITIALWQQLEALTPEQHALFCALACHEETISPKTRTAIRHRLASSFYYRGEHLKLKTKDVVKMHAIFFSNAVGLGRASRHGAGVCLQYSRINHSCTPNVANSYNATIGKLTVHAIRDIEPEEELTTSYITLTDLTKERQAELMQTWNFECCCDLCECKDPEQADKSDIRRCLLDILSQSLAKFEDDTFRPQYPSDEMEVPKNNAEALDLCEKRVDLLKSEGLIGADLAIAYRDCSRYAKAANMHVEALNYAKKELEIERICLGTDTDHLKQDMEGAKFWYEHLVSTMSKEDQVKKNMNDKREAKEQKKADKKADKKAAKKAGKGRR